mmetsp:Transcript_60913/g.157024  ORF Transcript_60913/g.157024 Transcript_60913/m.157024 type:complete len:388 (-) Transcript_60913:9-1172(-)
MGSSYPGLHPPACAIAVGGPSCQCKELSSPILCRFTGSCGSGCRGCVEEGTCMYNAGSSHNHLKVNGIFGCGTKQAPSALTLPVTGLFGTAGDPLDRGFAVERIPHPSLVNKELLQASWDGDHIRVRVALLSGADLHSRQSASAIPSGRSAGDSVEDADQDREIFEEHANPSPCSYAEGLTALMYAARGGHTKVVAVLLQARASVDAEDVQGRRPLHFAAASGNYDVGCALVCAKADCAAYDDQGRRALEHLPCATATFEKQRWQCLAESWCGPAAHNLALPLRVHARQHDRQHDGPELFVEAPRTANPIAATAPWSAVGLEGVVQKPYVPPLRLPPPHSAEPPGLRLPFTEAFEVVSISSWSESESLSPSRLSDLRTAECDSVRGR